MEISRARDVTDLSACKASPAHAQIERMHNSLAAP